MNYKVTLYNKWNVPYHYDKKDLKMVESEDMSSYATADEELCKEIIKDFLDVPLAELTLEQVKKDFSRTDFQISEERAVQIQNDYNGRFALHQTIVKDFCDAVAVGKPTTLHYDIPEKYNQFQVDDTEFHESQICAYLEVKLSDAA